MFLPDADLWQWAAWGEAPMNLHIGYEAAAPFALTRADVPDARAQAVDLALKARLRANTSTGTITLDGETTLSGIPPDAWTYKLGNRSALEWVIDDPMGVTNVSVGTVAIADAMTAAKR